MPSIQLKIISGGQTGIDRVALDAALESGLEHGGWCPKGRLAEDGTIPQIYRLRETQSENYAVRTEKNVMDSDGTLVIHVGTMRGGTALTVRLAARHGKPCFQLDFDEIRNIDDFGPEIARIRGWIQSNAIKTLNVAGPRQSSWPSLSTQVYPFLMALFTSE